MSSAHENQLADQVALVTGAGRGIGRACALALARNGAHVLAAARTDDDLSSLASEAPGRIEPWAGDVCTDAFVERIRALDRLDILVNNAGTNKLQHIFEVDDATLDFLLTLNIRSAFKVAQAAAFVMARGRRGGCIVNISSQMGHVGGPKRSVYAMTKHAIEGLTKAMAIELAEHNIRVNAVAPTVVLTSMTQPFFNDAAYGRAAVAMIPLGAIAQPEDVAGAVSYLVSPAARMVTGTSLKIDGGATAQ
jgi:NAD(P)-dependent dehydrogenase (short-subunit alcohol dehydrogenase family)